MRKTSQLLVICAVFVTLALSATACGKSTSSSQQTENAAKAEEKGKNTTSSVSAPTEKPTPTEKPIVTETPTPEPTETPTPEPTEAPAKVETSQLYKDFFEPYTDSVGSLLDAGFSTVEKLGEYQVEHTPGSEEDLCQYTIYDENGDHIYMFFYPEDMSGNPDEWIWTLSLLTYYSNGKEISINDNCHIDNPPVMKTFDPDRDPKNVEVKTTDELVSFIFG